MKDLFSRISLFTAALGAVAAVLGVLIVVRLLAGTQSEDLLATPARAPKLPEVKLDPPALEAQLEPLRDRALYYASRAFYVAPPPPPAPTAPPKPNYLLAGTFVIPHKHTVALLKQGTGTNVVKVKAGDDLEGWHIESVDTTRVVLRYQDERFEIARASREGGSHVTRAPLKRLGPAGVLASAAAAVPARAPIAVPATVAAVADVAVPGGAASGTAASGAAADAAAAGAAASGAAAAGAAASSETASAYAAPADTASPAPVPTVKTLGSGRSVAPIRDAALGGGRPSIEARLYRPPPQ